MRAIRATRKSYARWVLGGSSSGRKPARPSSQVNSMGAGQTVMPMIDVGEPTRRRARAAKRGRRLGSPTASVWPASMERCPTPPEVDGPRAECGHPPRKAKRLLGWIPSAAPPRDHSVLAPRLARVRRHSELFHSKARSSLSQLGRVNPLWLLAGFALEAAALVAYGAPHQVGAARRRPGASPRFFASTCRPWR